MNLMTNYPQAQAVGAVQEPVSAPCLLITNLNPKCMYAKQNNYTDISTMSHGLKFSITTVFRHSNFTVATYEINLDWKTSVG